MISQDERGRPSASAQAEIAGLRVNPAQAEQGMADGFAAADELLTERRAHARAERELKDKLAAAREAGRAVLASLRDQTVAAAEAPRGRGWLAPMLRRIGSRTAGQLQRFGRKPSVITLADRAQSTGNGSARPAYIGRLLIAILSIRRYGFNTVMR